MAPRLKMRDLGSTDLKVITQIGALFLHSAQAELYLSVIAVSLVMHPHSFDAKSFPAVDGMGVRVKLRVISDLTAAKFPPASKAIKRACGRLDKSFDKRHWIAHNTVVSERVEPQSIIVLRTRLDRKGVTLPAEKLTLGAIRNLSKNMLTQCGVIMETLQRSGLTIPDSAEMQSVRGL